MIFGGLQKTTLVDYPGKVACSVFTVGCNFRCPFCHNKDLVTKQFFKKSKIDEVAEEEIWQYLDKRKGVLDGVCITGGEPTLWPDLIGFAQKIKERGLLVKLDTNGSRPKVLGELLNFQFSKSNFQKQRLVDMVAMDVKVQFDNYFQIELVESRKSKVESIKKSIRIILASGVEHEFRTTVVPTIHDREVLRQMAKELAQLGVKKWSLQRFRPQNCLKEEFAKMEALTLGELERMAEGIGEESGINIKIK